MIWSHPAYPSISWEAYGRLTAEHSADHGQHRPQEPFKPLSFPYLPETSSFRNHDEKSSVARHFTSHNLTLSEPHYMGIETVKTPLGSCNRDRIRLRKEMY